MQIYLPHDHYDANHLQKVIAEMRTLGAPSIKAVLYDEDLHVALEGCHRLRAAEMLNLHPIIIHVDWDEDTTVEQVAPGSFTEGDANALVGDVIESIMRNSVALSFGD